jgi:hypothetical protein
MDGGWGNEMNENENSRVLAWLFSGKKIFLYDFQLLHIFTFANLILYLLFPIQIRLILKKKFGQFWCCHLKRKRKEIFFLNFGYL